MDAVHPVDLRTVAAAPDAGAVPILIVDDDPAKRLALKAVLAPLGHRIVEAESGFAALRHLIDEDFAVILMDVRMPIMDGFETAHLIRERGRSEVTPIIFITAYGSEAIANLTAYATGAADFIFSPVPPPELRAKVSVFANLYLRAESLAAQARQVQASADRLTQLTDAAPIGIFRTDAALHYQYVNSRWTEISGLTVEEAIGRPWDIVLTADPEDGPPAAPGRTLSEPFRIERRTDSTVRIAEVTAKPILGDDESVLGWVGTLSDVTAEATARASMLVSRDEAVAANVMQTNFAASASHELKTPTASVLGFIEEVLENDALSEDDRKCLDIAYRSAQRLSHLIDDLLILGEADIGPAMMHTEPTDLVPLVEFVLSSFAATAQRVHVTLVAEPIPTTEAASPRAMADPARLEQALTNLVSNAVKFTPPGGRVSVAVRTTGETVRITVCDTGMGIEESALDSIFERFYRAKDAVQVGIKGTGLGLAIARRMIEAQRGELTVTSLVGHGSTFTMTLPAAPGPQ